MGWQLYDLASVASLDEPLGFLPLSWPNCILRDVPVGLADAVVGEAVVRRVDKECAHGVKCAAYLASAVWDVYSILAFAWMTFEDEPVLVPVEGVVNGLAIAEDLVVLQCFDIALAPAGVFVFVSDEVGIVDCIVIVVGIVLIVHICFRLLFHPFALSFILLPFFHHPFALLPNLSFLASFFIRLFSVSFHVGIVQIIGETKVIILTTFFPNKFFLL